MADILNIFENDAFGIVPMTRAIRQMAPTWDRVGRLNLFGPGRGITQKLAAIELANDRLVLIDSAERGSAAPLLADGDRRIEAISVPHFPKDAAIYADEITGVRAFGSTDQYETVMSKVAEKLLMLRRQHSLTHEYLFARALHGVVIDPRGKVLLDAFTRFGFTQKVVNFDLGNSASDVAAKCREVTGHIEDNLLGDVMDHVHCLASPEWFDKFISHPQIKEAYQFWQGKGHPVRDDMRKGFEYAGIFFEEYRARSQDSTGTMRRFIDAEKARFFPVGTVQTFDLVYAPADWIETINTPGLDVYAAVEPMANRKKGVTIETQSNPLPICLNPQVLVQGE